VQWRRRFVFSLIALLLATGLYAGFRPQAVDVELSVAQRGPMQVVLEQEGRTRVIDRYVVTAPVSGHARRIRLDAGDPVARGATLAELDPARAAMLDARSRAEAEARVAAAASNVSVASHRADAAASNAALAQKSLHRARELRQAGHVSMAAEDQAAGEAERSAADLRSAQFAAATARHELELARAALQFVASGGSAPVVIHSPVSGQVLRVAHKSEGPVTAGQPLLEIGDPRRLEVEVDVLSADAVRIPPGGRVLFNRWGGEGILEGVVRVIEPGGFTKISALGVEEQRVWVIVAFTSPPARWERLGDQYRVEASFMLWEAEDVLQVPASALFRDGEEWAVFAADQGKAVKRRIQVGQRNSLRAQVLSGLAAGEKVIAHPDDRIQDGGKIAAR
jgi:HlyD family secretion protein